MTKKEIISIMVAQLVPFVFTFDNTINTETAIEEAKNLALQIYKNIEKDNSF